jgi:hypothetical protein
MQVMVIGLSLGSAAGTAASTVLKQRTATRTASTRPAGGAGLRRLLASTARDPLWTAAVVTDLVGVALQVVALHYGSLALVQPLLITGLLFALLLGHAGGKPPGAREVGCALVVAAALIGFLRLSGAVDAGPTLHVHPVHASVFAACVALAVVILVIGAHRHVPPAGRAGMLGVAVGAVYAATAALIKAATDVLAARGLLGLLLAWQLWVALAVGAAGLVLGQITFAAGPLTASLPAISAVDPLLSVLIGVVAYAEPLRRGPADGLVMLGLVAVLVLAIIGLSRVESTGRTEAGAPPQDKPLHPSRLAAATTAPMTIPDPDPRRTWNPTNRPGPSRLAGRPKEGSSDPGRG